jgi:hypothetical protein
MTVRPGIEPRASGYAMPADDRLRDPSAWFN